MDSDLNSKVRAGRQPAPTFSTEPHSATILFVDLRGYTGIAERLPAHRVARLLEELCGVLGLAIEEHHGKIYHIAGDGLMAGFGLRGSAQEGAADALSAGRQMLVQFTPMAHRWPRSWTAAVISVVCAQDRKTCRALPALARPPIRSPMARASVPASPTCAITSRRH